MGAPDVRTPARQTRAVWVSQREPAPQPFYQAAIRQATHTDQLFALLTQSKMAATSRHKAAPDLPETPSFDTYRLRHLAIVVSHAWWAQWGTCLACLLPSLIGNQAALGDVVYTLTYLPLLLLPALAAWFCKRRLEKVVIISHFLRCGPQGRKALIRSSYGGSTHHDLSTHCS